MATKRRFERPRAAQVVSDSLTILLRPKIEATLDALHHGLGDRDLLFAIGARAFGVEDDPDLVVDEVVRIIGEERIVPFLVTQAA